MEYDGGSFRDPSGRILKYKGRVLRVIFDHGIKDYLDIEKSGLLAELADRGLLLPAKPLVPSEIGPDLIELVPDARGWLEHPRLDYISYPYEWCFSQLRDAALLHLDLNLALLERDFTLSDATAYNVQFIGSKPIFIDHLSIVPYVEGAPWIGQRQFGMQFLNPLLLWGRKGVAPHAWFRGSVEGIPPEELAKLLGWRDRLSFIVLAHVIGPAHFARQRVADGLDSEPARRASLSKTRFVALLKTLRDYISTLSPPREKTVWDDYAEHNSYADVSRDAKRKFVANAVASSDRGAVFDIGCNSGDFSQVALDAGAKSVVGFDFDFGALERAYARFSASGGNVLPLWLDATNPSPAQGWAGRERMSMSERGSADCVLALAVIHHLAIAHNVPLDMAIDWIMGLGRTGVIEFPSKSDPMVRQLLRGREDFFTDYTEATFLEQVGRRGKITAQERLSENGRLIVAFDRR